MSDTQQGPGWWQATNGKWYPPESRQPPPPPANLPPTAFTAAQPIPVVVKNGHGCLWAVLAVVAIGIISLVVFAFAAGDAVDQAQEDLATEHTREARDVRLTDCGTDQFGYLLATLEVTNHSADPSTYVINVTFENRDRSRQFDTGVATIDQLNHNQTRTVQAGGLTQAPAGVHVECRVADVDRFASNP